LNCRPSEPHVAREKGGGRLPPFQNYYKIESILIQVLAAQVNNSSECDLL
jgi:hypothetical protein